MGDKQKKPGESNFVFQNSMDSRRAMGKKKKGFSPRNLKCMRAFAKDMPVWPLLIAIIAGVTVFYITEKKPDIYWDFWINKGTVEKVKFETGLKKEKPKTAPPYLLLQLFNDGSGYCDDVRLLVKNLKENNIKKHEIKYKPPVTKTYCIGNNFYKFGIREFFHSFKSLSKKAGAEFLIVYENIISSEDEFDCSVISLDKVWRRTHGKMKSYFSFAIREAFAEQHDEREYEPEFPKGQIDYDGYDPVVMIKNIYQLIKKTLSKDDKTAITKYFEKENSSLPFRGVDIINLNHEVINRLVRKNLLKSEQAKYIFKQSKASGGLTYRDYNIIVLQALLLDTLILNGKIKLEEGQKAIDDARVKESERTIWERLQ